MNLVEKSSKKVSIENEKEIRKMINKGGQVSINNDEKKFVRITINIPINLCDLIDNDREQQIVPISRNKWICEAIGLYLDQKKSIN